MKIKVLTLLPMFLLLFGCTNENDATPEKEPLKSITYEVLLFEFTPDTGNNSSRLHYEIKYTNPNNVAIKGFSKITSNYDGLILTPIKKIPPYIEIGAKSSFTEVYNVEEPFNLAVGKTKSVKLVSVEFIIVD
ncbi:conserved exported hypothetical protein [Flavobacterium sp. 9R]|uniref:hypothetical protein n=1 Tax=Flavobacterium sp. 9R TaxID=2653143 RepID=UPI0012F25F04|nr:hypothetical protein [Flavobacterium sp. 9R]VXB81254.1 conserved exported hypothetical protein [Flavobacterium sp. 9R]